MKPSTAVAIPQTTFLLQVWGGFALVDLFLLLFGINCWVWHETKINYTFIFEFDPKHHLDYRQYLEVLSCKEVAYRSYRYCWLFLNVYCFG